MKNSILKISILKCIYPKVWCYHFMVAKNVIVISF